MRWKQFFTPVQSLNSIEAQNFLKESSEDTVILDVRQPSEYEQGHIAGAKLIPLPILTDSLDQLERDQPIIVY